MLSAGVNRDATKIIASELAVRELRKFSEGVAYFLAVSLKGTPVMENAAFCGVGGFANYKMDKLVELFGVFLRHHYRS